jgi:hypothetical protein
VRQSEWASVDRPRDSKGLAANRAAAKGATNLPGMTVVAIVIVDDRIVIDAKPAKTIVRLPG